MAWWRWWLPIVYARSEYRRGSRVSAAFVLTPDRDDSIANLRLPRRHSRSLQGIHYRRRRCTPRAFDLLATGRRIIPIPPLVDIISRDYVFFLAFTDFRTICLR